MWQSSIEAGELREVPTWGSICRFSETRSVLSVFLGAALALVCTTFLGVVLGTAVGRFVPERIMKFVAAAVFLGFGAWTLAQAIRG